MNHPRVIIVGGGFGGLNTAKRLPKDIANVSLIDRRNYHLFQPLLYQVATAALSPADIAMPIRSILSNHPLTDVILGNVSRVDLENKYVQTERSQHPYDYLVLACGAKHSYFGHTDWEDFAPGLKTLEQATEIRRRILLAFELAEAESDIEKQKHLQTFIIVGGGPTGVELAGSIAEISRYALEKDFRHIVPSRTRVILIEASQRILGSFSEKLSKKAVRDLEAIGVQVWTSSRVTEVTAEGVRLGEEVIKAKTVIWAAGVEPSSIGGQLQSPMDKLGRVIVEADLSLKSHPEVFVIGDQSHCKGADGFPLPGLAPVAIQQGAHVAKMIELSIQNKKRYPFVYNDKGQMATIGRKKAVVELDRLQFNGFFAWLAWLFIHIYYLIGFKNRVFVFFHWAWAYFTFQRGARLIIHKEWKTTSKGV